MPSTQVGCMRIQVGSDTSMAASEGGDAANTATRNDSDLNINCVEYEDGGSDTASPPAVEVAMFEEGCHKRTSAKRIVAAALIIGKMTHLQLANVPFARVTEECSHITSASPRAV